MAIYGLPTQTSPFDAFAKGFGLTDNLMNQILNRNMLKQKTEHEKGALEQARKNHLESLAIQQMAQSRLNQMLPYQIQSYKDAHAKMDPNYALNKFKALQDFITGGGQPLAGGAMPQEPQQPQPTQEMGEGMGMFSPQGMLDAQQTPPVNAIAEQPTATAGGQMGGGLNMDMLRQHPMLRGFAKKYLGFDPLAAAPQTPEDKQAAALDLFKQKEQIKAANKTGSSETLTAPIKTKYQNIIGGVTSARPILKKIIEETKKGEIPGQMFGHLFKRDAQANYKGEVSTLLDGVRNAYTIPNTDSGTAKAEDKVLRKKGESDNNYAKRLQSILDQMDAREKDARVKLNAGNITAVAPQTVHLIGPNGEDYDVPESEVNAILKENPGVRRG